MSQDCIFWERKEPQLLFSSSETDLCWSSDSWMGSRCALIPAHQHRVLYSDLTGILIISDYLGRFVLEEQSFCSHRKRFYRNPSFPDSRNPTVRTCCLPTSPIPCLARASPAWTSGAPHCSPHPNPKMYEVEIVNGSPGLEIFLLQKWEYSLHLQFWNRMKKNKTKMSYSSSSAMRP